MDCEDVVILEEISESYERALMLRLLGPHHGLMLERIRSRIEVQIETRGGGIRAADIVAEAVEHESKKKLNPKDLELSEDGDWKWDGDEWVPASEEKDDSSED